MATNRFFMKRVLLLLTAVLWQVTVQAQIISTVAGTGYAGFYGEGIPATDANIMGVRGMAIDKYGNLYIVDASNYRIRKINTDGIITTIAGNGTPTFSGDGGMATNAGMIPHGITLDDEGNIYISGDNRVRKISTSGIITTIAGTGEHDYNGDNIPATAAKIWGPNGMVFDKYGNLYIADVGNSRVRKVSTSGIITTVAGTGVEGYNGDNILAVDAQLGKPSALAIDDFNRLYIGDQINYRIRRINKDGIISTIAGIGTAGYTGDNGMATEAKLTGIGDIVFDKYHNIYFSDPFRHCVRKVDQSGIISTVAGTGESGFSGDGGLAVLARLSLPHGLAINKAGGMYIATFGSKRVRYVGNVVSVAEQGIKNNNIEVYPNPNNGSFYVQVPEGVKGVAEMVIMDVGGRMVGAYSGVGGQQVAVDMHLPKGVYVLRLIIGDGVFNTKIVVE
jgi:hypothetical protein